MTMGTPKATRVCSLLLRLLALAATLAAAVVMGTSHETATFFNIRVEAKFNYTTSFVFFVIVNVVASLYSLLVLFVPPTSILSRFVMVFDVVITMLLISGLSAAGAISQVGKKGNSHAGWLPTCGQTPAFCDHVMGALISAFCGLLLYFVILLHSIHYSINPLLP